jgi:LPS export ABC transporter protein LptC
VLGIYLFRSGEEPVPVPINAGEPTGTDVAGKNIHFTQEDPAKGIRWTLNAESGQVSEDQQVYVLKEIRMKLESKDRPTITLTGQEGTWDGNTEVLNLQGHILVESEDQYRLQTEQLTYDMKGEQLATDQPIRFEGPFFTVEGSGLLIDVKKKTFKIQKHFKTVINSRPIL